MWKSSDTLTNIPFYLLVYLQEQDGKKFIVPAWKEVLPETTLEDINWVKPKPKKVSSENHEFQFESKSDPGHFLQSYCK